MERKGDDVFLSIFSEPFLKAHSIRHISRDLPSDTAFARYTQLAIFRSVESLPFTSVFNKKLARRMFKDIGLSWHETLFMSLKIGYQYQLKRLHDICLAMPNLKQVLLFGKEVYITMLNMSGSPLDHFGTVFSSFINGRKVVVRVFCSPFYWGRVRKRYVQD